MKGIPGRYIGDSNQSRVIYPSSKQSWFILLLVISKILHCVALFLIFDLLKIIDVISLTFFLKLISGICFLYIQKPFSSGPALSQTQWFHIGQYSVLRAALTFLWLYGISLCGPFRSILVTQHYDVVIITAIGTIFSGVQSPAVLRGIVLFALAIISLLFLDHDESQQHPGNSHLSLGVESWFDLADHKLGVIFLCGLLPIQVGANMLGKRVGADIGSQRRLQAFSSLLEAFLCLPWTLFMFLSKGSSEFYSLSSAVPVVLTALLGFVFVYYVESACSQRFEMLRIARIGSISMSVLSLCIASLWVPMFWIEKDDVPVFDQHGLSGGGVFACILFVFATLSLTTTQKQGTKGSFVGYSSSGLPLYNFTNSSLHQTSKSIILSVSTIMKQILSNRNSRRIFYFLCLNISFTIVEFAYGIWTNSLGLISDGFHMLFDCSALVMGLLASVMACWKPSKTFSYGYGRIEDLSGFVNSLFLLVISFFVFSEAASRVFDPPQINTQRLLVVSLAGLFVNLIGIFAFRHGSSHSHSQHGHGHSHGHGHMHAHSIGFHGHTHNANMEGVFLHIMADTLGSVGVIVSSLLIEQFGWYVADPICSIFIAILIFLSVLPLLKQSACVLVLMTPPKIHLQLATALSQVSNIGGVMKVHRQHFWQHSSEICMGTLHVQASPDASEQSIIQQVCAIFKDIGIQQFCVQVEKEEFFTHLSGLGSQVKVLNYGIEFPGSESLFMVKAI